MSSQPKSESSEFKAFQKRLTDGESTAARQLFDAYSVRLIHLASQNIHPRLAKRFDGEDVVQSVFRTFFRRHEEGKFRIEHSQQLWQLLAALTLCKTRSHARRHTAEKRDAANDHGMSDGNLILDRQASHEDAVALWEEIDVVLDGLPERAAEIVSMRLEGRNRSEIAERLGLSRQTIHRLLKLVQHRLEQRFEQLADPLTKESEDS